MKLNVGIYLRILGVVATLGLAACSKHSNSAVQAGGHHGGSHSGRPQGESQNPSLRLARHYLNLAQQNLQVSSQLGDQGSPAALEAAEHNLQQAQFVLSQFPSWDLEVNQLRHRLGRLNRWLADQRRPERLVAQNDREPRPDRGIAGLVPAQPVSPFPLDIHFFPDGHR